MVTIATNMAGRGTDIVLGGNVEKQVDAVQGRSGARRSDEKAARIAQLREEWQQLHDQVVDAGGLHIIGTERHESRRIDNQLRGRSGRQGDPGSSRFYLSLEDPLLRIFAGERIKAIMERLKMPEGEPIEHPLVTRSIESAQRKVEAHNFDIRKQLLEYDDVANDQRKIIYELRNEMLEPGDVTEHGEEPARRRGHRPLPRTRAARERRGAVGRGGPGDGARRPSSACTCRLRKWLEEEPNLGEEALLERIIERRRRGLRGEDAPVPPEALAPVRALRSCCRPSTRTGASTSSALDHLRQGIHLRGYAQKNPKQEYKREAFELFARDARGGQARGHAHPDERADPTPEQVRRSSGRGRGARSRRTCQYQHPDCEDGARGAGAEAKPTGDVATERKPAPFVRADRQGRAQRSVPVRLGQEVQALPRAS